MAVRDHNKHVLFLRSGNLCAFPGCKTHLVEDKTKSDPPSIVGVICHIKGQKSGSSRYDLDMLDDDRDSVDNLILFCPTHHKLVDDQPNEYTVENLQKFKYGHEKWVRERVSREVSNITFSELDVITKYLVENAPSEYEMRVVSPKEKIRRNELSEQVENQIRMGMAQVNLVREFIKRNLDLEFGERLRSGFVDKYNALVKKGLKGDELFYSLFDFASMGNTDFRHQAAGLVVLSYFFESCDVFEI
jgi:hypothetical protein